MKIHRLFLVVLVTVLSLGIAASVSAQGPQPPAEDQADAQDAPPRLRDGPRQTADHQAYRSSAPTGAQATPSHANTTSAPNYFGYTWTDSAGVSWIDATSGTDTGMSGSSYQQRSGPVALPFTFPYFENTYSALYIAAAGYIGFTDDGNWPNQPTIPSTSTPNNIIAPYASNTYLAASGPSGRIYYLSGGVAPNRYFVVEWYDVKGSSPSDSIGGDDTYRYELVLRENGDFDFYYQTITVSGGYYCGTAGMEDSAGSDSLVSLNYCVSPPASNLTVHYARPPAGARVGITPQTQAHFTTASATESYLLTIRNIGDLGGDRFELTAASGWLVFFYQANGVTPLADTDSDSVPDTGPLGSGQQVTIMVKVLSQYLLNVGDTNVATITARSALDSNRSRTATLQGSSPAPFASVFQDSNDGAIALELVAPSNQTIRRVTANNYYGYSMAVAETHSFVDVWREYGYNGTAYNYSLHYSLQNAAGDVTRAPSTLTDLSAAIQQTYDYAPAVAVAPNGRIGVAWYRRIFDNSGNYNYNVYFAVLDSSGNIVVPPTNLTNNTVFGTSSTPDMPFFAYARIAATGDNRFVIAWRRYHLVSGNSFLYDVWDAIRDTDGGEVQAVSKFTNDTPGGNIYSYPTVAALSGNRVLLAYLSNSGNLAYSILDSAGSVLQGETSLGENGYYPDAVQLSDGRILLAWHNFNLGVDVLHYAILNSSYALLSGPAVLSAPAPYFDTGWPSVVADAAAHGIITWSDLNARAIFYALVRSDGTLLTGPQILLASASPTGFLYENFDGAMSTSNSQPITSANVDAWMQSTPMLPAAPSGQVTAIVRFGNHGLSTATSAALTATLDPNLSYVSAGPAPSNVSGQTLTWNLSDIGYLANGWISLQVTAPNAAGLYPITWQFSSAGPEANALDNSGLTFVGVNAIPVYLPSVLR